MEVEKIEIKLTLSLEEAQILKAVLDNIGGTGDIRNSCDNMSSKLECAGFTINPDIADRFKGSLHVYDLKWGE